MSTTYTSKKAKKEVQKSAAALHKVTPKKSELSNIQPMESPFQSLNLTKKLMASGHTSQPSCLCE